MLLFRWLFHQKLNFIRIKWKLRWNERSESHLAVLVWHDARRNLNPKLCLRNINRMSNDVVMQSLLYLGFPSGMENNFVQTN